LKKNYMKITLAQPVVYFLIGGLPAVIWGFALRTVFSWHITWAVNSVSHMWGRQMFKTDDLSMNNPLIGVLAQGEGWHNNHHAFQDSCRHGLKWWQIDMTWYGILALEKMGLASKLRYPDPRKMEALSWENPLNN
jgi:fatty-acid desaturase